MAFLLSHFNDYPRWPWWWVVGLSENPQGHSGKMSASFPFTGSIPWAVTSALEKDWKTLTTLGMASYLSVNLYNSSESWNHRLLELKMTFCVIKFNFPVVEIETLKRCVEDHRARKWHFRCPWDGTITHIYYCNRKAMVFQRNMFYSWNYTSLTLSPRNPLGPGAPGIPGLPVSPWGFRCKKSIFNQMLNIC